MDSLQQIRHCRARPYLALRTARLSGPPEERHRRWLEIRPGDPPALARLGAVLARGNDWRALDSFVEGHDRDLRARLSNVALAKLAWRLAQRGWRARAEMLLSRG